MILSPYVSYTTSLNADDRLQANKGCYDLRQELLVQSLTIFSRIEDPNIQLLYLGFPYRLLVNLAAIVVPPQETRDQELALQRLFEILKRLSHHPKFRASFLAEYNATDTLGSQQTTRILLRLEQRFSNDRAELDRLNRNPSQLYALSDGKRDELTNTEAMVAELQEPMVSGDWKSVLAYRVSQSPVGAERPGPDLLFMYYRIGREFIHGNGALPQRTTRFFQQYESLLAQPFRFDVLRQNPPQVDKSVYLDHVQNNGSEGVIRAIFGDRYFKRHLYETVDRGTRHATDQAWLTINNPLLVQNLVERAVSKNNKGRDIFSRSLKRNLGLTLKDLVSDRSWYVYYADDILDALAEISAQLGLDSEMQSEIEHLQQPDGVRIRIIQRQPGDLSLGRKCGDCTALGSANFDNSVSWIYNPSYLIVKVSYHGHFLGRFNYALADVNYQPGLIIDALEFKPQVREEGTTQRAWGQLAFSKMMNYSRHLAKQLSRKLFALPWSNSAGANDLLVMNAGAGNELNAKVFFPTVDASVMTLLNAYLDPSRPLHELTHWFQANTSDEGTDSNRILDRMDQKIMQVYETQAPELEPTEHTPFIEEGYVNASVLRRSDVKLFVLEDQVFNPAQQKDIRVTEAIQTARNSENSVEVRFQALESASRMILADVGFASAIQTAYRLEAPPPWIYVANRIKALYFDRKTKRDLNGIYLESVPLLAFP